ncbi:MAG: tetratricopeptide repeat protein [Calditrichaeota bacterium]|nr:tetratricopeptide repeat protein [Calditrichota bacterium]
MISKKNGSAASGVQKSHVQKLTLIITFLVPILFWANLSFSRAPDKARLEKQYEAHVWKMIDEKTSDFYYDMVYKEQFLTIMMDNLVDELKVRKKEKQPISQIFDALVTHDTSGDSDSLIQAYSQEIRRVLGLMDELKGLEKKADQENDRSVRARAEAIKNDLKQAIEGNTRKSFSKTDPLSKSLISEYQKEIDQILAIFKELEHYEALARAENNQVALSEIAREKSRLEQVLSSQVSQSDNTLEAQYFKEMENVISVLYQLDHFRSQVNPDEEDLLFKIDALKEEVLTNVDRKLLRVLGYTDFALLPSESKFDEFLEEWKATQIFNYKIKLTRVRLLRQRLIQDSNLEQLNRMFRRDLADAIMSYNREEYPLAELEFRELLAEYPFQDMEDIHYRLAEIYMAQGKYEKAKRTFDYVIQHFPNSKYVNESYFKILLITEALHQNDQYFKAFKKLQARYKNTPKDAVFEKAYYLTGYVYFKKENYDLAIATLRAIPENSEYALSSEFLLASAYAGEQRYRSAAKIFRKLVAETKKRSSDPRANLIKNNSLLKLGMIYYENNEPKLALDYFSRVSEGDGAYQDALIGKAWAEFREGQIKYTVEDLDRLFWNFMSSNTVYEAKTLSAHCYKMMGDPARAARDLRYVENAKKALAILTGKNKERETLARRLQELDQIQEDALKRGDRLRFQEVVYLKQKIRRIMENTYPSGKPGLYMMDEFEMERQRLEDLVGDLETYQKIVQKLGYRDLTKNIGKTKNRLLAILGNYSPHKWAGETDFLSNYPFLQRQSMLRYKNKVLSEMLAEIQSELNQVQGDQKEVEKLVAEARKKGDIKSLVRLDFNGENLDNISDRLEEYVVYLNGELDDSPEEDIQYYADFSGFGVSDIDFVRLQNIDEKIKNYYDYISLINNALNIQQLALKDRIYTMSDSLRHVQQRLEEKRKEDYRKAITAYFNQGYFVSKSQEHAVQQESPRQTQDQGIQELLDKKYPTAKTPVESKVLINKKKK